MDSEWWDRLSLRWRGRQMHRQLVTSPALLRTRETLLGVDTARIAKRPLATSRFVAIDTETTGLHAYGGDAIVAIALLELEHDRLTGREYLSLVNPQRPIPPAATAIHGLGDRDVAGAPTLGEVLPAVVEFIGDAVLVGHHIQFDLRFINRYLMQVLACRLGNPALDTMLLYLAHSGRIGHYTLEEVSAHCGIAITDRHSARGDALAAAGIFHALAPKLATAQTPVSRLLERQFDNGP